MIRIKMIPRVFFLSLHRCTFKLLINNINYISIGGDMLIRRNLIITLSLFVFSFVPFAQNTSYLDSLEGQYALQFQISDNFNLTNFQGTTFSGKYHFGCRNAVRAGLSIDLANTEGEANETLLDTTLTNSYDTDQNGFSITIKTQFIQYVPRINNIAFFVGGGPFINFYNNTSKTNYPDNETVTYRKEDIDNFTFGVDLLIGVEWMFSKNTSLSAEYGIQFYHSSYTRNSEDNHLKRKVTEKKFRITRGDLNFGISVYF